MNSVPSAAESPLPEGSQVHLSIEVPGDGEPLRVGGLVSHTVVVEDEDVPGMGIVFQFKGEDRVRVKAVIDQLEQRFQVGDLPDDILM